MRTITRTALTAGLLTAGIVLLPACSSASSDAMSMSPAAPETRAISSTQEEQAPAATERASDRLQMRQYAYYPQSEVYQDLERGTFFWQEGEQWHWGPELPSHVQIDEADMVQIPLATDYPFRVHMSVQASFPQTSDGVMSASAPTD
jgi:hypothetical protein